ncbi:MAG: hypothetical protein GY859_25660 [Desulfobacterales bacterium]|nr:hypothetical protein [Desulfobacterales bacterium]
MEAISRIGKSSWRFFSFLSDCLLCWPIAIRQRATNADIPGSRHFISLNEDLAFCSRIISLRRPRPPWGRRAPARHVSPYVRRVIGRRATIRNIPGVVIVRRVGSCSPPVRRAFAHSINIEKVIQKVLRNDYFRLNHAYEGYGRYSNDAIRARKFDVEKVAGYMKESGWERGADGIWVKNGKRFSVELTYSSDVLTPRYVVVKEEAKKAGVEILLEKLDGSTSFKKILEKNHEVAMMAWSTSFRPRYWQGYHSDNAHKTQTNNITNADDPALDKLVDKYHNSTDAEERIRLSIEIQQMLHDLCYFIPTMKVPYFREAYWRWWKHPDVAGTKHSDVELFNPFDESMFWYDEDLHKETLEAMKNKKTFPPVTIIDETFKTY